MFSPYEPGLDVGKMDPPGNPSFAGHPNFETSPIWSHIFLVYSNDGDRVLGLGVNNDEVHIVGPSFSQRRSTRPLICQCIGAGLEAVKHDGTAGITSSAHESLLRLLSVWRSADLGTGDVLSFFGVGFEDLEGTPIPKFVKGKGLALPQALQGTAL